MSWILHWPLKWSREVGMRVEEREVRERYRTKAPQEVRMSMRLDGLEGTHPD